MTVENLQTRLAAAAERLDTVMAADLATVTNHRLKEVLEHALLAGGKRIRPLLTLLAARLTMAADQAAGAPAQPPASSGDPTALERLAIAFEYLHTASLLHDDVIDHAAQRRGRDTVNHRWDGSHAILAGDFLHARAMRLAGSHGGPPCLELIGTATEAMVAAEFLQAATARQRDWRQQTYFAVLDGKTAALIAAACECGAAATGGDHTQRRALRVYGANLGLAFQIIDDLLDFLGEPQATGKAAGNDLQEGKMTLPLLLAHERATADQRRWLERLLAAEPAQRRSELPGVRELLEQTGAFAACRAEARGLLEAGRAGLEIFPDGPERQLLQDLGDYVLRRDR
ncbi:MAG: polyprenyl synthetase family protein [Desulfurivibrio sp.]|nr:polyprenyl synthetase family protein [Desulfurivibrio sp.]